jgi:hypothetical protein
MNDDTTPTTPIEPEGATSPTEKRDLSAESAAASTIATPTIASDNPDADYPTAPRPIIRWGGVVWGALFAAFGAAVLWMLATPGARDGVIQWTRSLGPWGAGIIGLIALGALILVLGIVSAANKAQRGRRA